MTVIAQCLFETAAIPAADTTLVTGDANTRTYIDKLTVTNTTGGALTVNVNIVASGGSVGATNLLESSYSIAANTSYSFPNIVGQILNPGDFLSVHPSGVGCNARVSGRKMT